MVRETRQAFRTTAFVVFLAVLVGLALAAEVASGGRDFFRADKLWLYLAILAAGYLVSRGLAKAGSAINLPVAETDYMPHAEVTGGQGDLGVQATGAVALPRQPTREGKQGERNASRGHDEVQAERMAIPHRPQAADAGAGRRATSSARRAANRESRHGTRPIREPADPFERVVTFAAKFVRIIRRTLLVAAILSLVVIALIVWLITRLF